MFNIFFLFYFYSKNKNILQTKFYSQQIDLKKLHQFLILYFLNINQRDFMPSTFILHPMVTANYMLVYILASNTFYFFMHQYNCDEKWIQRYFSVSFDRIIINFQISVFFAISKPNEKQGRNLMFCSNLSILQHFH